MHYATMVKPQRLKMGTMGDEEIFADCATCGEEGAVIAGGIQDDIGHWAIERLPNGLYKQCVYCAPCYSALLAPSEPEVAPSLAGGA